MNHSFSALRGAMVAKGLDFEHVARALLVSPTTFSSRMNARYPWTLDEQYQMMDLLSLPYDQLHAYFPRYGGLPKPRERSKSA